MDEKTQRPKGFGFVTYESEVEAHKALKAMNGRVFYSLLLSNLALFSVYLCIQGYLCSC